MPRPNELVLYGATGHSGRLIAFEALRRGLRPLLMGRNVTRLRELARETGLPFRCAALSDEAVLTDALSEARVLLNAASPFRETALRLVALCLRSGVHYLDICGELDVFRDVHRLAEGASASMVLPGVGFIIVPGDCLVAHLRARCPAVQQLRLAVSRPGVISSGSYQTMSQLLARQVWVRRGGQLVSYPTGSSTRSFDFGHGPSPCVGVSWPDVFTAALAGAIDDIEVFAEMSSIEHALYAGYNRLAPLFETPFGQASLRAQLALLPRRSGRAPAGRTLVAEGLDGAGCMVRARLRVDDSYVFTARASVEVVFRALANDVKVGFQTPTSAYGVGLVDVLSAHGIEDLPID